MLLLDDGDPVFLLGRDGEAAGTFSRHSPEGREGGQKINRVSDKDHESIISVWYSF